MKKVSKLLERALQLTEQAAKIPSFSSREEVIHPFVHSIAGKVPGCKAETVNERNIIMYIPGKQSGIVAFTAHLDKINHFGMPEPETLPFTRTEEFIEGQLDNTVGIGVLLTLLEEAPNRNWPDLVLLFSEMEESTGLKKHPQWLRNGGEGLYHGMGAEKLADYLITTKPQWLPDACITIDTTPLFKGEPGCAVYSRHWEFTGAVPTESEIAKTRKLVEQVCDFEPDIRRANNTNDYLVYGKTFSQKLPEGRVIPGIAIELAIFPYHQKNERVFVSDIDRVLAICIFLLDAGLDLDE
ncbi:MAG: hypothetical protein LAT67_09150 [Balneolales bacterium]|nr:hypothetical protein [Balneolales bacterium]